MKDAGMRAFTVLLVGQAISLLGSMLTGFSLGVWAYQKAGSVTDFAMIALAASLPAALLSPVAGTVVDRYNRKTILLIGQTVAVLLTLAMATLYWLDMLEVWHIILLSALSAIFNAFVMPAIASSITMLVPVNQLTRANGMMSLAVGVVHLIAPAIAGALLLGLGLKAIFLIDLTTFVFGVTALLITRIPQPKSLSEDQSTRESFLKSMRFGWNYILQRKGLLGLLLFYATISFNVAAIGVLITPMVLGFTDAAGLGIIASVSGFGMVLGSMLIMAWGGPERKVFGVLGAGLVICVGYILAPIRPSAVLVALGGLLVMSAFPIATACSQQIFQRKIAPDVQGRVFGFRAFIVGITSPIALLIAGPLADGIFEPMMATGGEWAALLGPIFGTGQGRGVAVMICVLGCISMVLVILAWLTPSIRKIDINLPNLDTEHDPGSSPDNNNVKEDGRTEEQLQLH